MPPPLARGRQRKGRTFGDRAAELVRLLTTIKRPRRRPRGLGAIASGDNALRDHRQADALDLLKKVRRQRHTDGADRETFRKDSAGMKLSAVPALRPASPQRGGQPRPTSAALVKHGASALYQVISTWPKKKPRRPSRSKSNSPKRGFADADSRRCDRRARRRQRVAEAARALSALRITHSGKGRPRLSDKASALGHDAVGRHAAPRSITTSKRPAPPQGAKSHWTNRRPPSRNAKRTPLRRRPRRPSQPRPTRRPTVLQASKPPRPRAPTVLQASKPERPTAVPRSLRPTRTEEAEPC